MILKASAENGSASSEASARGLDGSSLATDRLHAR